MIARWFLLFFLSAPLASARAAAAGDDGARALTVRVWSTRNIRTLSVQRLEGATSQVPIEILWQPDGLHTSVGAAVKQQSLSGNYRLAASGGPPLAAAGKWSIVWKPDGLRLLLTLPSERYVVAALNGEAAADEPLTSLKAMAVTIRTFALAHAGRHAAEGFGLCDSTHCQALRFGAARPDVERAVRETAGETLWFHGRRASVYYTQHCGGESEAARALWPEERATYLNGHHADPYCVRRSPAAWHATIPLSRLSEILRDHGWRVPSPIDAVTVMERSQTGRAERVEVSGHGSPAILSASSLRFAVDRALGWNQMRSDWFTATVAGPNLVIAGKGYGHGVGLCQAGAFEMAVEGHSEADILGFYLPGLIAAVTPAGQPWRSVPGGGWTLLTTQSPGELMDTGNAAWSKAQTLGGWGRSAMRPIVQELPNTELFRQTTRQPGWMLASTSHNLVFLQPPSLRGGRAATESLLVHEFLHVLIEQQAGDRAPLWLREGLVEMLAGLDKTSLLDMTAKEVDAALDHAASAEESRHAHRVAASMATLLCGRYGLPVVLQFLHQGVPPEIGFSSRR